MTLTLNFCYNSSAHDCLVQTSPQDVTGLKSNKSVSKLLRAFCRGSGIQEADLDQEARQLEIGKCFCHSHNPDHNQTSKLFSGDDVVDSMGLRDGDHVFVRRIQRDFEVKKEEQLQEMEKSDSGEFTAFSLTMEGHGEGKVWKRKAR